jgi:transcriptional regulator with XRE-family HTH domain
MRPVHTEGLPPNRLRELLKQRDLKLVDVAALCRVDQSTAWRWAEGVIPQQHLPAIARFLGVTVPYLAGWTDDNGGDDKSAAEVAA